MDDLEGLPYSEKYKPVLDEILADFKTTKTWQSLPEPVTNDYLVKMATQSLLHKKFRLMQKDFPEAATNEHRLQQLETQRTRVGHFMGTANIGRVVADTFAQDAERYFENALKEKLNIKGR